MEFKFQDSGTYQVYSVEYTTDGYVRGTGPTQSYGTPLNQILPLQLLPPPPPNS